MTLDSNSNIYSQMQQVKIELQQAPIKKSGFNSFQKFKFYQLQDFLPTLNVLCAKHNLHTVVSFDSDLATLTITNMLNPKEQIKVTSPMVMGIKLQSQNEMQVLGSIETYQRRYVYVTGFDIVEGDGIDGLDQKETEKLNNEKNETIPRESIVVDEIIKLLGNDLERTKAALSHFNVKSFYDLDPVQEQACLAIVRKGNKK